MSLAHIPYRLRHDVLAAGHTRETRCVICNADGEGLDYCPDHEVDEFPAEAQG